MSGRDRRARRRLMLERQGGVSDAASDRLSAKATAIAYGLASSMSADTIMRYAEAAHRRKKAAPRDNT